MSLPKIVRSVLGRGPILLAAAAIFGSGGVQGGAAPAAALPGELVRAAREWASRETIYDPGYYLLRYPGGDPGPERGVCTDLVVRAFRGAGIDLQVEVHEDLSADFDAYPARSRYGSRGPDPSIDHRRVGNLAAWLRRHWVSLPAGPDPAGWEPGDIVVWDLRGRGGEDHVGIISDRVAPSGRPLVLHHFPPRPAEEDVLERWKVVGHYRAPAG